MANGRDSIQFGVGFNVNQNSLNSIKSSLQQIQKMSARDLVQTEGLSDARARLREIKNTASEVEKALEKCFNSDLGTLNVTKFNKELKNLDINKVYRDLSQCGTAGTAAFRSLATEILTTNTQLKKTHQFLDSMAISMKNTIKWGITSSAMNNFTGSVRKAYSYVKDLDSSLNSIRIVSGQSAEQMAEFAVQANNAAKELGATTTAYTDAALIFYQQGDPADVVTQKTQATIKMANVLGETASQVSDYMTAIWNNFDDGSYSLEHYGDVLTALGASTASSSEEIAEGLEKFAGVASSVGLSYEYATSALATVVAETRQSADTVGTAFKTLFARLQGLELGETLEDGTSLNKYSEALAKVGVNIKDQNGELKDMDDILDDLGSKWNSLARDQKVALAQVVAGTRQYNQLVSLMDNWDVMNENLETASNATGTLEEQQNTYMDSVEAHLKSMKASFEDVYDSMLSGDSVKTFSDAIGEVADKFASWIDSIGGGGNVLLLLGSIATKVFSTQIANGIATTIQNFKSMRENASQAQAELALLEQFKGIPMADKAYQDILKMKEAQMELRNVMSESQINMSNQIISNTNEIQLQSEAWQKTLASANEYLNRVALEEDAQIDITGIKINTDPFQDVAVILERVENESRKTKREINSYNQAIREAANAQNEFNNSQTIENEERYSDSLYNVRDALTNVINEISAFNASGVTNSQQITQLTIAVNRYKEALAAAEAEQYTSPAANANLLEAGQQMVETYQNVNNQIIADAERTGRVLEQEANGRSNFYRTQMEENRNAWNAFIRNCSVVQATKGIVDMVNGVGQLTMAFSSLKNIGRIFEDEDLSTAEKFEQIMMALATGLPMLQMGLKSIVTGLSTIKASFISGAVSAGIFGVTTETSFLAAAKAVLTFETTLGPIWFIIVAVTAAVVALSAGIYALVKAENADADAEKRVAKTMEELGTAADDAKQAVTDLQNALDSYDTVIETLNECTKGTQEWYDALEDVNNKVLELLDAYPELLSMQGAVTRDANGMLTISKEAQNQILENAKDAQNVLSAAATMETVKDKEVKQTSAENDFLDKHGYDMGTIVLENIDELSELTGKELSDRLKDLFMDTATEQNMTADEFDATIQEFVDAQPEIQKLAQSATEAATALDNATFSIASSELGDKYSAAETAIAAKTYGNSQKDKQDEWQKKIEGVGKTSEYSDEDVKEIWDAFNEANHSKLKMDTDNGVIGSGKDRKFQYEDPVSGETKSFTAEHMASVIASAKALDGLEEAAEKAKEALGKIDKNIVNLKGGEDTSDKVKAGIKDFVASSNLESMDKGTLSELSKLIKSNGGTKKFIGSTFGDGNGTLDNSEADELGATSAQEFIDSFSNAFKDAQTSFDDIGKGLLKSVKESFDKIDTDDLNIANAKTISQTMQDAFVIGGQESLDKISTIFNQLSKDGEIDEFATAIEEIEWDTTNVDELSESLKNAGVTTSFTDVELQDLIDTLSVMSDSTTSLIDRCQEVNSVISGLSDDNNTISSEDYDKLGEEYQKYFALTMDGTYKLTMAAEEFKNMVKDAQIEEFDSKAKDEYANAIKLENLQNSYNENNLSESQAPSLDDTLINGNFSFDTENVQTQIEIIREFAGENKEMLEQASRWSQMMTDGTMDAVALQQIADATKECAGDQEEWNQKIEDSKVASAELRLAIAESAESINELDDLLEEDKIGLSEYNQALGQMHEAERMEDLDYGEIEDYADYLMDLADAEETAMLGSEELSDELADNEEAAKDIAIQIKRMNKGVKSLADNWEEWSDILKNSSKGSEEYCDALNNTRDAMSDLLDISSDYMSADFVDSLANDADAMALMEQAANGDGDAIDALRQKALEDIVLNFELDDDAISNEELWNRVQGLQAMLDEMGPITAGTDIDLTGVNEGEREFIDALNQMIADASLSKEQVNATLSGMGFSATYAKEEQKMKYRTPDKIIEEVGIVPKNVELEDGTIVSGYRKETKQQIIPGEYVDGGSVEASAILTSEPDTVAVPKIESVSRKASGSANNYSRVNAGGPPARSSSGGGPKGGGGSKKSSKPKSKDPIKDQIDRYHDVNIELQRIETTLNRIEKTQSKLVGQKLFNSLTKEAKQLNKQADLYNKKLKIAKGESKELKKELTSKGAKIDNTGMITNYKELMKSKKDAVNKAIAAYNAMDSEAQEAYQDTLDKIEQEYKDFKDSVDRYDTLINETIPGLKDSANEAIDEATSKKIEAYELKISAKLDTSEADRTLKDWLANLKREIGQELDPLSKIQLSKDKYKTYFSPKSKKQDEKDEKAVTKADKSLTKAEEKLKKEQDEVKNQKAQVKKARAALEKAEEKGSKKKIQKAEQKLQNEKTLLQKEKNDVEKAKKNVSKKQTEKSNAKKETSAYWDKKISTQDKKIKDAQKELNRLNGKKNKSEIKELNNKIKKANKDKKDAQKDVEKYEKQLKKAWKTKSLKDDKTANDNLKTAKKKLENAQKKIDSSTKKLKKEQQVGNKNEIKKAKNKIKELEKDRDTLARKSMKKEGYSQVANDWETLDNLQKKVKATQTKKGDSTYGKDTAAALEDLKTAQEQLMTDIEDMQDLVDEAYDAWLESIDDVIEGHEKLTELQSFQSEQLEHNLKLVQMLGGAEGTVKKLQQQEKVYASMVVSDIKNTAQLKDNADYYWKQYSKLLDKNGNVIEGNEDAAEKWLSAWQDTTSELNSMIEDALDDALEMWTNKVELSISYMNEQVTGGFGLEYVNTEWELTKKNAEQYLDSVESAYEITKLESQVQSSIDGTKSLSAQKKIKDVMGEQLQILYKKDKVSQYDLDRAKKVYDLTLKQIALEDAKNSKNTMSLKRDSQGNYSYQYSADVNKIQEAEDALLEAESALYTFDKAAYQGKLDDIYATYSDFQDRLKQAYIDSNGDETEYLAQATLIEEQYREILQAECEQAESMRLSLSLDTAAAVTSIQSDTYSRALTFEQSINDIWTRVGTSGTEKVNLSGVEQKFTDLKGNADNSISNIKFDGINTAAGVVDLTGVSAKFSKLDLDTDSSFSNISSKVHALGTTDENFDARLKEISDKFKGMSDDSIDELLRIGGSWYGGSSTEGKSILDSMTDKTDEVLDKVHTTFETKLGDMAKTLFGEGEGSFYNAVNTCFSNIGNATSQYATAVQGIATAASGGSTKLDIMKTSLEGLETPLQTTDTRTKTLKNEFISLAQNSSGLSSEFLKSHNIVKNLGEAEDTTSNSSNTLAGGINGVAEAASNSVGSIDNAKYAIDGIGANSVDAYDKMTNLSNGFDKTKESSDLLASALDKLSSASNLNIERTASVASKQEDLNDKLEKTATKAGTAYSNVLDLSNGFKDKYLPSIENAVSQTQTLIDKLNNIKDKNVTVTTTYKEKKDNNKTKNKNNKTKNKNNNKTKTATGTGVQRENSLDPNKNWDPGANAKAKFVSGVLHKGRKDKTAALTKDKKKVKGTGQTVRTGDFVDYTATYPYQLTVNGVTGWVKLSQLAKLDTGGYTGEWGSSGKLAMLHEKEIVLNKEDTSKFLDAISIVRKINDSSTEMIQNLIGNISGGILGILGQINSNDNNTNAVEQKVEIKADFPGVKDSKEIEDAFNNLINTASQYAFSKR